MEIEPGRGRKPYGHGKYGAPAHSTKFTGFPTLRIATCDTQERRPSRFFSLSGFGLARAAPRVAPKPLPRRAAPVAGCLLLVRHFLTAPQVHGEGRRPRLPLTTGGPPRTSPRPNQAPSSLWRLTPLDFNIWDPSRMSHSVLFTALVGLVALSALGGAVADVFHCRAFPAPRETAGRTTGARPINLLNSLGLAAAAREDPFIGWRGSSYHPKDVWMGAGRVEGWSRGRWMAMLDAWA